MVPVTVRVEPPRASDAPWALLSVSVKVSSSASSTASSVTGTETVWLATELAAKVRVPVVSV